MAYLVLFWGLIYSAFVIWLLRGWQESVANFLGWPAPPVPELLVKGKLPTITVVIPVRNEEHNLPRLIGSLLAQSYPAHLWHAVFVDDDSTDGTLPLLQKMATASPEQISVVHNIAQLDAQYLSTAANSGYTNPIALSLYRSPKKRAILAAITTTHSNLIVTTDGDCELPKDWLAGYGRLFSDSEVQAVSGPVSITGQRFTDRLQTMEFGSLIVTGGSTLGYGWATLCNGANLAYRRAAFHAVQGFTGVEHQPSGDDEFLWHKLGATYPEGLAFAATSSMMVSTPAVQSWSQFVQQRLRWASKWSIYQDGRYTALAAGLGLWQLGTLLFILLMPLGLVSWASILILLSNKLLADYLLLRPAYERLGIKWNNTAFVLVGLLYPVYGGYFALRALLAPSYTWKGRKFSSSSL